ncbi:hypothetical protein [Blastopirellula retiformator]|uniref:Uncharacterized protein n=1 Tax=Blastopirellula retiformator TaxID=2527970 RepID=A0A5C5VNX2_9BACT|nr:hypothetical protein [Blastopirellula retiformator]TWT39663.1 hypothetical protein Enr8_13640 [Blastopirellula retiformator]
MLTSYPDAIANLIQAAPPCPLGPGTPVREVRDQLSRLSHDDLSGGRSIRSREMADACLSGIWLLYNYLDESHEISQNLSSITGSYWHGIMHRREPDYGNAKYWFRRVGHHPIMHDLAARAAEIASGGELDAATRFLASGSDWDPMAMVDGCEAVARGRSDNQEILVQTAAEEWRLLFDYCLQEALGS